MSDREDRQDDSPQLFDLPLEPPSVFDTQSMEPVTATPEPPPTESTSPTKSTSAEPSPEMPPAAPAPIPDESPLQQAIELQESQDGPIPFESEPSGDPLAPAAATPSQTAVAPIGPRLLSGGADLLIHAGALAGATLGLRLMGVDAQIDHWPAMLALLLAFSFLYTVVSLAFWGQTAGMAWFGLAARESQQFPLSFSQACTRWLGGWLTTALLGLPLLLTLAGASLSDRLSRSRTYRTFVPSR